MRGHIQQRSTGSWTIQASGGFNDAGKRVRITRTVRGSRRNAERALTKLLHEVDTGTVVVDGRTPLGRYLEDRWLPHAATRVRPTTHERYQSLLRGHVEPRIGRVRLANLRPFHIQSVVDGMVAEGLAPRTVGQAYRVLSAALRQGVRWQVLSTNPALAVAPPRLDRPILAIPDGDAVRRLVVEADGALASPSC